jgi:hypothetical protein
MPPLRLHRATPVPCPRTFPGLPLSGLRWLLHAVDGDGLREDAATTGHPSAAAAWDHQGRADGPPRARVGGITETAPYPPTAHPGQPERDGANRRDARHRL